MVPPTTAPYSPSFLHIAPSDTPLWNTQLLSDRVTTRRETEWAARRQQVWGFSQLQLSLPRGRLTHVSQSFPPSLGYTALFFGVDATNPNSHALWPAWKTRPFFHHSPPPSFKIALAHGTLGSQSKWVGLRVVERCKKEKLCIFLSFFGVYIYIHIFLL